MLLINLDDALKMILMSDWCNPSEYFALLCSSKHWSFTEHLRSSALFALSRWHAPECDCALTMRYWYVVWHECKDTFRRKHWDVSLWKDACVLTYHGKLFVAHEPFFYALDAMLAAHYAECTVRSVLATSIRMHPYVINVLLFLSSGAFAFLGAVEIPESDSDEEEGSCMRFNVVVATTLHDLEEKAVQLIASSSTSSIDVRLKPWYLDNEGALQIYLCYIGANTQKYIHTQDPFLPLAEDLLSWRSAFTEEYFFPR